MDFDEFILLHNHHCCEIVDYFCYVENFTHTYLEKNLIQNSGSSGICFGVLDYLHAVTIFISVSV